MSGTLRTEGGKPIPFPIELSISGFPYGKNGEHGTELNLDANIGAYDIKLEDGIYHAASAVVFAEHNGKKFVLPLAATDGQMDKFAEQREAKEGIVRDFVWKLSGPKPGGDEKSPNGYWGASLKLDKPFDLSRDASGIEITLTPTGPLIDGSKGRTITFTNKLPWQSAADRYVFDVPIGSYTASAQLIYTDGRKVPVKLSSTNGNYHQASKPSELAVTCPIEFESYPMTPKTWKVYEPDIVLSE